jgi:adenylate cyclase
MADTVDKIIGDGVMAVFGFPSSLSNDGERAFQCPVEMSDRLAVWSERRAGDGMQPLEFGIGAQIGNVIGGALRKFMTPVSSPLER